MFKRIKKLFEKEKVTVQKFKPFFITTDGIEHEGLNYNWVISNRLRRTVPQYLMTYIKTDGYMKDINEIMYPLTNIISIRWDLLDEKIVEDRFSDDDVFVTTEELESVKSKYECY